MLFFTDISVISIIVIIVVIAVVFYRFFVILVSKATVRLLAPCGLEIGPKSWSSSFEVQPRATSDITRSVERRSNVKRSDNDAITITVMVTANVNSDNGR